MSNGEGIRSGDLLHKGPHQVGGHDHVDCGEKRSQDDQLTTGKACVNAGGDEDVGEPVKHMAGEEYGLKLCKPGKQQVDGETDDHNDTDLRAVLAANVYGGRGYSLGHDGGESGAHIGNGAGDNADTLIQNEVANGSHEGAANDLRGGFLLKQQAYKSNQGNKDSALSEDLFDDKIENSVHTIPSYEILLFSFTFSANRSKPEPSAPLPCHP